METTSAKPAGAQDFELLMQVVGEGMGMMLLHAQNQQVPKILNS